MIGKISSPHQVEDDNQVSLANAVSSDNNIQIFSGKKTRALGSIYTPTDFAEFLTAWAIRHPEDHILDLGIGEGAFVFAAYRRLLELGALNIIAQQQLFGAEIDKSTYSNFIESARNINAHFLNLKNANFFDAEFPLVDAIVGNPPYIRRTYLNNVDEIRKSVIKRNLLVGELNMTRMTDMYIYFLLHALPLLKPGGRLAVITSDPWLNVGYGEEFKKYLHQHFRIEMLISLDRRVFDDADVKSVLILATKLESPDLEWKVKFVRVKNGLPIVNLHESLSSPNTDIVCSQVRSDELKAFTPWDIHFKAPEVYEELETHKLMTNIANIAETRIGIQTLAKEFFVLSAEQANTTQIEKEFMEPLAQSIRYISHSMIDINSEPNYYLFYCDKGKDDLQRTQALEYILQGEASTVDVRGKNDSVVGYQNKERIKKAKRNFWYNLKSSLERRGRARILIPRLIYRNFTVVWNVAKFVPGELFIEFLPSSGIDDEVYLAILTSSISELMLRTHAQIYGGGTFNINPGRIKSVPMLNVALLTYQQREALKQSYQQYLSDETHSRSSIDHVIYDILGLSISHQHRIRIILEDLLLLATSTKKPISR
jgi:adenine-specific DNA-methyltransferase